MSRHKRIAAGATATGAARPAFDLAAWWQSFSGANKKAERLKPHELTFILRTLSTLVSNGVSLPKALATLAREDTLAKHRHLLESLRRKVESGVSFSAALNQFPQVCDPITASQIRLGERSGTLSETLQHLSENRGKSAELKQAVIKKLAYPCLLITLGSGLLTFLLMYVVPVFEETYANAKVPLPLITRMLISFSGIVQAYGPYMLGFVILTAATVQQLRKREEFAVLMDRGILRVPVVGKWIRDMAVLQLMEVLHSLMSAGYNLAEAVRETAQSVGNRAVRQGVRDLQIAINRGERFSRELERHEDMFPPIVNQLVIVGESTGQLTRATKDICDYLRHEIERKTSLLVGALEPILTIGLASAIAVVLLAIYLPMFDMVNTISK
ncbi:MAG: type II secretion system F family protein [Bythopirellula sp.]|nr:type II secretion system F family protein [Bythopirellula sp.]